MSLNDIELPDSLIDALYGSSSLIRSRASKPSQASPVASIDRPSSTDTAPKPQGPQVSSTAPSGNYKFLGNNQRKISILVDSPDTAFLPDDQLAFLTKMLEACKMNIGDVAIVNQAHSAADIAGLKRQLQPAQLLLFGPAPSGIGLPINFPQFKIQAYDQCSFLWVPALDQLVQPGEESKLLKTKLWVCLKTLFGI